MKRSVPLPLLAFVLVALPAGAQEPGQVGLTMGYPASIGVIYHVGDKLAVRPDFAFSVSSSESTATTTLPATNPTTAGTTDATTFGVGFSVLRYMGKWDDLRAYMSPRFSYSRNSATGTGTTALSSQNITNESVASVYTLAGSFGAQYSLGRRFAVFGETGLAYSRRKNRSTSDTSETRSTANGLNSFTAVGGIFYFR